MEGFHSERSEENITELINIATLLGHSPLDLSSSVWHIMFLVCKHYVHELNHSYRVFEFGDWSIELDLFGSGIPPSFYKQLSSFGGICAFVANTMT